MEGNLSTPLIRGGQGRSDASVERDANLIWFCLMCGCAVLLFGFFLTGCACDRPEDRLQKTFDGQ